MNLLKKYLGKLVNKVYYLIWRTQWLILCNGKCPKVKLFGIAYPRVFGEMNVNGVLVLRSGLIWNPIGSMNTSSFVVEKKGILKEKISLVPNGCDLDIFNTKVKAWRPREISDTDLLVLFAGTHGIANGLDSVLDAAIELILRGRHDIKFLFLGQGKLKSSLIDRANEEGIDNVIFHQPVDKRTLAGLMSSTDIGLQILANIPVFYYGTSPNKFFDYISAGVPVLNNYPGWLAEMIDENRCGFSVPPDDPIAFANVLEKAADNRIDLKLKGSNARKLAINKFDRKILATRWVEPLEAVYSDKLKNK